MDSKNTPRIRHDLYCINCDLPAEKFCKRCGLPLCKLCAKTGNNVCVSCAEETGVNGDYEYGLFE